MSPAPNATARPAEVLDIDGVCDLLDCGPRVVLNLVRLGQIPHRQIDGRGTLRFSRIAILRWLDSSLSKEGARA